ncbi:hypothetical protein M405DRAFT_31660 [Rhizopogon salebrosus TDB-379]|nr:hypothetical protein M405DRAFT_31660 [Rhizopogon salebrosus TDB-379]
MLLPVTEGSSHVAGKDVQMWMELPVDRNPFPDSVKLVGVRALTYEQVSVLGKVLIEPILSWRRTSTCVTT